MSKRGWLTPDASLLSNPLECRKISVPGDFWYYVQGALEELSKSYNWKQIGTATPEEMAQYFMDVLDEFSISECEKMRFIDSPEYALIVPSTYTQAGQPLTINHAMLPIEAQGAKAIYVRLIVSHNLANQIIQANTKSGNARIFERFTTSGTIHLAMTTIPMDEDGAEIRSNSQNGTSVYLGVYLVGWWK